MLPGVIRLFHQLLRGNGRPGQVVGVMAIYRKVTWQDRFNAILVGVVSP